MFFVHPPLGYWYFITESAMLCAWGVAYHSAGIRSKPLNDIVGCAIKEVAANRATTIDISFLIS